MREICAAFFTVSTHRSGDFVRDDGGDDAVRTIVATVAVGVAFAATLHFFQLREGMLEIRHHDLHRSLHMT